MRGYLLIDDEAVFNTIHAKIISLVDEEASITSCVSSYEALDLLKGAAHRQRLPDMIFLDINMPEMNGFELLDELSQLPGNPFASTGFYMLTSSLDERDLQRAKTYSFISGYHSKPMTKSMLEQLIKAGNQPG